MTSYFYLLAGVLTAAFLAVLLRPLLRLPAGSSVSQQRTNVAVYAEQIEALKRERDAGALSKAEFETARDELQLRLLEDEQAAPVALPPAAGSLAAVRRTAVSIALLMPLGAGGMYAWLGMPSAIDAQAAAHAQQDDIVRMVEALAARLRANPDNPQGWAMLARSYKALGRLDEAERAYARVGPALAADPDMLTSYADLVAARTDSFAGQPMELIAKALALEPNHPMGLMLAGTADYRDGRFGAAARHWEKLVQVLGPDSPDAEQLLLDIAEAREKAGMPQAKAPVAAAAPASPEQMVARLAARLKANPDDPAGWTRLARSYEVLGKAKEAEHAHAQARLHQAK